MDVIDFFLQEKTKHKKYIFLLEREMESYFIQKGRRERNEEKYGGYLIILSTNIIYLSNFSFM